MQRFLFLSYGCLLTFGSAVAQEAVPASVPKTDSVRVLVAKPVAAPRRPPRPRPLHREFAGGINSYSDGWGFLVEKGYVRTEETGEKADQFYDVRSFSVELANRRDARRDRTP